MTTNYRIFETRDLNEMHSFEGWTSKVGFKMSQKPINHFNSRDHRPHPCSFPTLKHLGIIYDLHVQKKIFRKMSEMIDLSGIQKD